MKRDLVSLSLWTSEAIQEILTSAASFKNNPPGSEQPLKGKSVALLFERQSLRTRVSFEVGITQLGGHPIFLEPESVGMAARESVHDVAKILSQYNHLIAARTIKHRTCIQLAESATVPVINAMTDLVHPCQVLADAFTLREAGRLNESTKVVYLGDGNTMANSWMELAEKIPFHLVIATPPGYAPHPSILEQAAQAKCGTIELEHDPVAAVANADVLYTDAWPSLDGGEEGRRAHIFRPYQINKELLKRARKGCVVMHRLPANRGEEITGEILDSKQSLAFVQAANRLHVQNALMAYLLRA